MKIGIIGIGSLTLELAQRATSTGYEVLINHPRGNSLIQETVNQTIKGAKLVSLEEAASTDITILFVPRESLEHTISRLPDMSGKIILHTSGLIFNPKLLVSSVTSSLTYQITASLLPEANVVKLFNPVVLNQRKTALLTEKKDDIYFAGENELSKNKIKTFLNNLEFQPIDLSVKLKLQSALIKENNTLINHWHKLS
ncbi:NAD(P)-binding domain-containing protein [Flavobacterium sp. IB48]|uniref:NAD(P)-binding domain-containing protein n=1 Tax=Flavobacterium sp. IB48 TaxID=2779375 RepID=UPI0018E840FC|nr:NAD(P)-binding domain-containing protein [Flavobacterium sp. IB48]MBJ2125914.1 NAD(P)-binding domain-containing protein [Flavobacterium sp. IB48]